MPAGQADWALIKRRYEEGLSAPAIEKEITVNGKPKVSRQAILKRARKEGWLHGSTSVVPMAAVVSSAGTLEPTSLGDLIDERAVVLFDLLNADGKKAITRYGLNMALRSYATGNGHAVAAGNAAVSADTWQRYRDGLPQLEQTIVEIQARHAMELTGSIDDARKRGDWKAAEALLKTNPLTRPDWQQAEKGNTGVAIQISFGPGMPAEAMRTIDDER